VARLPRCQARQVVVMWAAARPLLSTAAAHRRRLRHWQGCRQLLLTRRVSMSACPFPASSQSHQVLRQPLPPPLD